MTRRKTTKKKVPAADTELFDSQETKENKKPVKKEIDISLKGKYLPHILVKLGYSYNNAEARQYIRSKGIKINNKIIKDIDFQLKSNTTIKITLEDVVYRVHLL